MNTPTSHTCKTFSEPMYVLLMISNKMRFCDGYDGPQGALQTCRCKYKRVTAKIKYRLKKPKCKLNNACAFIERGVVSLFYIYIFNVIYTEWLFVLEQYIKFGLVFVLQWEPFLTLLRKYSFLSMRWRVKFGINSTSDV